MLEIASQMILCLLLAALLGFIIGYLFGKGTCASDDCGQDIETHDSHTTSTGTTTSHSSGDAHSVAQSIATTATATSLSNSHTAVTAKEASESRSTTSAHNEAQAITETAITSSNGNNDASSENTQNDASHTSSNTETNNNANDKTTVSKNTENKTSHASKSNADDKPILLSEPRNGKKDNLTRIKGIGIKIEESLNDIGIYHFDQIAAWDAENIAWADSTLGFPGRAEREQWVSQAKILATGEETEFSKRVAEGKVSSSKQS